MAMAIGNLWEEKIKMGGKLFRDFIIFELGQLEVVPCLAETFAQIAGTGMGLGRIATSPRWAPISRNSAKKFRPYIYMGPGHLQYVA